MGLGTERKTHVRVHADGLPGEVGFFREVALQRVALSEGIIDDDVRVGIGAVLGLLDIETHDGSLRGRCRPGVVEFHDQLRPGSGRGEGMVARIRDNASTRCSSP
jgi:hypothetical protein